MSYHPGLIAGIVAAFAILVYAGGKGRTPEKADQVALKPTNETFLGIRDHDDMPQSTIEIEDPHGESFVLSLYADGVPYQPKGQPGNGWKYKYTVHRVPIDYDLDLGGWAGLRVGPNAQDTHGLDMGIRYSPVRFAYGVISPDLLVSPRQIGLGVSAYPPSQTVNYRWQHLGLGLAYMADYRGGSGWMPYASLSTRF